METIIVASDFSPTSLNAADYAAHLAMALNAQIHLVHTYDIPLTYAENPLPAINIEDLQEASQAGLDAELKRMKGAFPQLNINAAIYPGGIIDNLKDLVRDKKPLLVIMGIADYDNDSFLWRNIAVQALRHLSCAVMCVPMAAVWCPVKKICFSADYNTSADHFPFDAIRKWVALMNADLQVVYVKNSEESIAPDDYFKLNLEAATPKYYEVEDDALGKGVGKFLEEQDADWLMMLPKKYGFFKTLFQKSRTEILTRASRVPVLALHMD